MASMGVGDGAIFPFPASRFASEYLFGLAPLIGQVRVGDVLGFIVDLPLLGTPGYGRVWGCVGDCPPARGFARGGSTVFDIGVLARIPVPMTVAPPQSSDRSNSVENFSPVVLVFSRI